VSVTEAMGGTLMVQSVVFVIISILGTMQTLKGFLQLKDGKWYALIMVAVAVAYSYVFWKTDILWLKGAIVAWSLAQIGYETLLKTVLKILDGVGEKFSKS